jgi:hypothetical protein
VSFKKKRIPHELILKGSEWEQPYEKNRWLLWSIAALICAGLLSLIVVLSLFPKINDEALTNMTIPGETRTQVTVPIEDN